MRKKKTPATTSRGEVPGQMVLAFTPKPGITRYLVCVGPADAKDGRMSPKAVPVTWEGDDWPPKVAELVKLSVRVFYHSTEKGLEKVVKHGGPDVDKGPPKV